MSESIGDIVREMRECADRTERGDEYAVSTDTIRVYADRIEAAAKSASQEFGITLSFYRAAVAERDAATAEVDKLRNELQAEMRTCERLRAALRPVLACPCNANTTADEAAHNCMDAVADALHIWWAGCGA